MNFESVNIFNNFYQASSFFPMPVVLMSTRSESGRINLGPYSLCFPHFISGENRHGMMFIARGSSNTAQNLLRTKKVSINFLPMKRRFMKNCVELGFPGETTEEKMKNSIFTLQKSTLGEEYPDIVSESIQVFECTWDESYPLKPDLNDDEDLELHFLLTIDRILMPEKWKKSLLEKKRFPVLPVDYGYRNNSDFWFARHLRPFRIPIPKSKSVGVDTIIYATDRLDPDLKWEKAACEKLVKVPRPFLSKVLRGILERAKADGVTLITPDYLDQIREKK